MTARRKRVTNMRKVLSENNVPQPPKGCMEWLFGFCLMRGWL